MGYAARNITINYWKRDKDLINTNLLNFIIRNLFLIKNDRNILKQSFNMIFIIFIGFRYWYFCN